MSIGKFLIIGVFVPWPAWAADQAGDFSIITAVIQMIAALALVIGLICLAQVAARRWLGGMGQSTAVPRYIRVVESRYLAPKKSLLLVEVGGEYLLLSDGTDGVQFIKQVELLEEIEVIEEPRHARLVTGLKERLTTMSTGLPALWESGMTFGRKPGAPS